MIYYSDISGKSSANSLYSNPTPDRMQSILNTPNGRKVSVNKMPNSDDCFSCVKSIPLAIGHFFTRRYDDLRQAYTACFSRCTGSTLQETEHCNMTFQFDECRPNATFKVTMIDGSGKTSHDVRINGNLCSSAASNNVLNGSTAAVSSVTMSNRPTIDGTPTSPIVRQRTMAMASSTTEAECIMPHVVNPLISAEVLNGRATTHRTNANGVDLNIPGTILYQTDLPPEVSTYKTDARRRGEGTRVRQTRIGKYIHDQMIPEGIKNKAKKIEELSKQLDSLDNPPDIPELYQCCANRSIMEIPVFDASHRPIQDALKETKAPDGTMRMLDNRALRHCMDVSSLESLMQETTTSDPKFCPTCRHPKVADDLNIYPGIQRENMVIDVELQEEILLWLEAAVR